MHISFNSSTAFKALIIDKKAKEKLSKTFDGDMKKNVEQSQYVVIEDNMRNLEYTDVHVDENMGVSVKTKNMPVEQSYYPPYFAYQVDPWHYAVKYTNKNGTQSEEKFDACSLYKAEDAVNDFNGKDDLCKAAKLAMDIDLKTYRENV